MKQKQLIIKAEIRKQEADGKITEAVVYALKTVNISTLELVGVLEHIKQRELKKRENKVEE